MLLLGVYLLLPIGDKELRNMEVTDISDTDTGDFVKITGKINASRHIVISGNYSIVDGEEKWVWYPTNFYIHDGNGTIWVVAYDLVGYIGEGRIRYSEHPDRLYRPGDTIYVIGTVEYSDSRGKRIRPEYISTNPEDFGTDDAMLFYILGSVIVAFFSAGIVFGIILLRRKKLHQGNIDEFFPIKRGTPSVWEVLDKKDWEDFDYNTWSKTVIGVMTVIGLLPITMYIVWIVQNYHEKWFADWWFIGIIFLFMLVVLIYAITVFSLRRRVGESTLCYEVDGEKLHIDDIEGFLDSVVGDLNLEYKKVKKEYFINSWWMLMYNLKAKGGKIIIDLQKYSQKFEINIILRPGRVSYVSYHDRIKDSVEQAFDDFFSKKAVPGPKIPVSEANNTYLKQEEI